MALIRSPALKFLLVGLFAASAALSHGFRVASSTIVGGWMEIADVKKNKEVQELGRFSVEEYNRSHRPDRTGNGYAEFLRFGEVVEAHTQVVSGIKYYLKVTAIDKSSGEPRIFDSVVVVQPWLRSKKLLRFHPTTDQHLHFYR